MPVSTGLQFSYFFLKYKFSVAGIYVGPIDNLYENGAL